MTITTLHPARTAACSQDQRAASQVEPRRRTAVPLLGPADTGTANPVMGVDAGTVASVTGTADTGTATPVMGVDAGTVASVTGTADTGTATPVMSPRQ
jgi:hypothetical protein